MKWLNLFKKTKETKKTGGFSDFFLHASEKEKGEVFMEAARMANEQQQETFLKSKLKAKVG